MSFFDKFFSHRNRNNKNENALKGAAEPLSFRSSHLTISKDQIRFVLFRECERRGRKLLFDSSTVEKIPLPSRGIMCNQTPQPGGSEKIIDFIETTTTHGYKYKKPSNDVACLGEMIFGSVAVVYKGETSCKIHSIPSPKRIMFTTIVYAHSQCQMSTSSDRSLEGSSVGSSLASLNEMFNRNQTSSSDSKLYRREGGSQNQCSATYPWLKQNTPLSSKGNQCCGEIHEGETNLVKKCFLLKNKKLGYLDNLRLPGFEPTNDLSICNLFHKGKASCEKIGSNQELTSIGSSLNVCQRETDGDCGSYMDSSFMTSNCSVESDVSSVSGSLSSLRRRWAQSCSTSLDSTAYEDTSSSSSKKRTKLGMAVVLDLSNTAEEELEKFLYNHTIIIDSIMSKLQSSVEMAYIKNKNFVDLIYTAFIESQQSIHQLITGGKYEKPIWVTLIGNPDDDLDGTVAEMNSFGGKGKGIKKQDSLGSIRTKFLHDFCDVLVKFDTKDTNFFISTLLTAVLTHHLSWVTSIAETDTSMRHQKLRSVIKQLRPYNPLWAQLNDLCGLLGSPLKCAKTVITGSESKRNHIATIIEVLTYFIRCFNVVENIYDVDVENIVGDADLAKKKTEYQDDSDIDSDMLPCNSSNAESEKFKSFVKKVISGSETDKSSDEEQDYRRVPRDNLPEKVECSGAGVGGGSGSGSGSGLKRSKSVLTHLKEDVSKTDRLYPDLKSLAKSESVTMTDLECQEPEKTVLFPDMLLTGEKLMEKIQRMIRVPKRKEVLEGYLSVDEGYDTIGSSKTDDNITEDRCGKTVVKMEKQFTSPTDRKNNIVFVLGENEELVNLPRKVVVTKSSTINLERENSKELFLVDYDSKTGNCENEFEGSSRTLSNKCDVSDRTLWSNCCKDKPVTHSRTEVKEGGGGGLSWKVPWVIRELPMPRDTKPCRTERLDISSVLGGVNQHYNSEQIIQGVLDNREQWEDTLRKDLYLCAHNPVIEKDINEALCIIGDVDSWEVSVCSSNTSTLDKNNKRGVRVGMSQLVADMLESFLYLRKFNLAPNFCLLHLEKKLHEIYLKSKTVAELLNSTELCSLDYLTTRLDIEINDVPLLLSVATTHSPHISEKYGLSFT